MNKHEQVIGWMDIARGVGELIVDEAKLLARGLTHQFLHETPSEHHPAHLETREELDHRLAHERDYPTA